MGSIPIMYSRSLNDQLYVRALTAAYRSGYRVYDVDYALSKDPDVWEIVRRDPVIEHAIQMRLHRVAGRNYTVSPKTGEKIDKVAAATVKSALSYVSNFTAARYELATARFVSRNYQYMEGQRTRCRLLPDQPEQDWWLCYRLRDVDRRRVRHVPEWSGMGENRTLNIQQQVWSIARERWEQWTNPEQFIKLIVGDSEERLGYGRGLLEAMYFYHYLKVNVLREGMNGLERWAQGFLIGKIDGLRIGSTSKTNSDATQEFIDVMDKMRARHSLVMDKNDEVEMVQPPATGHQMVGDFLQYFDNAITRLILGAVLPTGGDQGTGSNARAETEAGSTEAIIQFDREVVDESVSRDLIGAFWRLNKPQLEAVGLGMASVPKFETTQEEREDPRANAEIIKTMLSVPGIKLKKTEVHEKIGLTLPTDEDDVYEGAAVPAPFGGNGFGGLPASTDDPLNKAS